MYEMVICRMVVSLLLKGTTHSCYFFSRSNRLDSNKIHLGLRHALVMGNTREDDHCVRITGMVDERSDR